MSSPNGPRQALVCIYTIDADWLWLPALPISAQKAAASIDQKFIIEEIKVGKWKLKISKRGKKLLESWEDVKSALPLFHRLCLDVVIVAPRLSALFLFCLIWEGIQAALSMYFSTALLRGVRGRLWLPGLSIHMIWDLDRGRYPHWKA